MYTVTRSQKFIVQYEKLCEDNPRLSDLSNALDWHLNRKPHDRAYALGKGFYLWITAEQSANIHTRCKKSFTRLLTRKPWYDCCPYNCIPPPTVNFNKGFMP